MAKGEWALADLGVAWGSGACWRSRSVTAPQESHRGNEGAMPTPFGPMRMSTKSELSYGTLFLVVSLVARSVALAAPVGLVRDSLGVFSIVMLVGGLIVVIVGLWHAARRGDHAPPAPGDAALGAPTRDPGWFPDQVDSSLLRFWNGHAWTGDTAHLETSPSPVTTAPRP